MLDPLEGVSSSGTIETGASEACISSLFRPVLDAAIVAVRTATPDASLYVYGSVATGRAQPPRSDVDLLTIGLAPAAAADIAPDLSGRFSDICRAVEVAVAQPGDFVANTDEAHGGRVFLRHYCVHLAGPDLHAALPEFAADARAARGFNGDIAAHARHWRRELEGGRDPAQLGRRVARKSLLALAGLVSVHDETWTTDRATAATRWAEIEPSLADDLSTLLAWSSGTVAPNQQSVEAALDGVVTRITASFADSIGLWDSARSR
jgi:hypothetical protein